MKKHLFQLIADSIIECMAKSKNQNQIIAYYRLGMWFNRYSMHNHKIYLN